MQQPHDGGVKTPLTEEETSTAPAFVGEKPTRFIKGMVKLPVVTTLAMEEPEISPEHCRRNDSRFSRASAWLKEKKKHGPNKIPHLPGST